MVRWIAVIFFFLTPIVFAGPIRISFDDIKYEVNLTKDSISFDESGFSKRIKKQKCNRSLVHQFTAELKTNIAITSESKKTGVPKGAIRIAFSGKDHFALRFESEGRYFADLPSKFKNLWLTSERVCKR